MQVPVEGMYDSFLGGRGAESQRLQLLFATASFKGLSSFFSSFFAVSAVSGSFSYWGWLHRHLCLLLWIPCSLRKAAHSWMNFFTVSFGA